MTNSICYGDIVYLEFNNHKHVLFSNGFYDPALYLASTANPGNQSFRNGLFKIYSNLSYKDASQVEKLEHQLDLLKSLNPEEKYAARQLEKDIEIEKKLLEARESKLDVLNEKMYNEAKGVPIRYGQKVQLLHIESQSFVTVSKSFNKFDQTMTNIELTRNGSKDLYFMFIPKLSFVQDGEVVEYNTPIKIASFKTGASLIMGKPNGYLILNTELNPSNNLLTNDSTLFPRIEARRKQPIFQTDELLLDVGVKIVDTVENTYVQRFISLEDREKAKAKKALKNGDYIRISNERVFLTIYLSKQGDKLFFQTFGSHQEYKLNHVNTLFQIMEIQDAKSIENSSVPLLPQGHMLEYDESKSYLIRHFVSGKYLSFKDRDLQLMEYTKEDQETLQLKLIVKNQAKDSTTEKYINSNSVMQLRPDISKEVEEINLTIGKPSKISDSQYDLNTRLFFGFENPDNYLNRQLRTERFDVQAEVITDEQFSCFKLVVPTEEELHSIFLAESLVNHIQKFMDFFDEFLNETHTIEDFNEEIGKLLAICNDYNQEMFEGKYTEDNEDILTLNSLRQTLLREFRVYDLIYRIFYYIILDAECLSQFKIIQNKANELSRSNTITHKSQNVSPIANKEEDIPNTDVFIQDNLKHMKDSEAAYKPKNTIDKLKSVNFAQIVKVFALMEKMIILSFKKNNLNHFYCSQFVRVSISGVIRTNTGILSYASYQERLQVKELMLSLCKEGLWDQDLDALGQLNHYEAILFSALENQESFHTVYLQLLTHIFNSQAPNLQNIIRNSFLSKCLSDSELMIHAFPELFEENDHIYLRFQRRSVQESIHKIHLEDLANEEIVRSEQEQEKIKFLMTYLTFAFQLILALKTIESSLLDLRVVRYYKYETLIKVIKILEKTPYRELKTGISELISETHQKYFAVPFITLPKQLQIVMNDKDSLDGNVNEINNMIKKLIDNSLSETELTTIRSGGDVELITTLQNLLSSKGHVNKALTLIKSKPGINDVLEARAILESIEKVLKSGFDVHMDFLERSRESILRLLKEAIIQKRKSGFDFIKQALLVFNTLETKTFEFAAIDIANTLRIQDLLNVKGLNIDETKSPKLGIKRFEMTLSPTKEEDLLKSWLDTERSPETMPSPRVTPGVKIAPAIQHFKEQTTRGGENNVLISNVVEISAKQWKTGERYILNSSSKLKIISTTQDNQFYTNTSQVTKILLEVFLLNQDYLSADVIQQLQKISIFERLLYKELDKLTILYDSETLEKVKQVIKITFRLNEISREVFFCNDSQLEIEDTKFNSMLGEVLELQWQLFFIIYDTSKHFRYSESEMSSNKRFRDAFEDRKKLRWDICTKLESKAIVRPFQKLFSILKTFKPLMKIQSWVLERKTDFSDTFLRHSYIIRLNVLILTAFVKDNKDNQFLFSTLREFITSLYKPHFIEQTPDILIVFAEVLRNNKKLLKLSKKYLYDIVMYTFVKTMVREITNHELNGYLCASIASYHFLCRALIPTEIFNPLLDMKSKWKQTADVDLFSSLNIENVQGDIIKMPYCYYSIYELMHETIEVMKHYANDIKHVGEMQAFLNFSEWLSFFQSENYVLQFELKNLVTKCIHNIYFKQDSKNRFIVESDECVQIVVCLLADIISFRKYVNKSKNQESSNLQNLLEELNFITENDYYRVVMYNYQKREHINFETTKLQLFLEDISLHNLLYEYIYDGCFTLLFSILLKEAKFCEQIVTSPSHGPMSIMEFTLRVLGELIMFEGDDSRFPYSKVEKFLNEASVAQAHNKSKKQIIEVVNKFYTKAKKSTKASPHAPNQSQNAKMMTPVDKYIQQISVLNRDKRLSKEQNIKVIADHIAEHPEGSLIIREVIKYLKRNIIKLESEEIIFIIRLLRKYIEIENSYNVSDEPIYIWKEISYVDLRRIERIQFIYRELGLSEFLYVLFALNDTKIFRETLLLSIAYMYGGNRAVQEDFYEQFLGDEENRLLTQVGKRLQKSWGFFRGMETERINHLYTTTQKVMFRYMSGKTTDADIDEQELQMMVFQASDNTKYSSAVGDRKQNKLFMLILTFLQALCEGQYNSMQKFLREQRVEGRLYFGSFNFLSFLRHSMNTYYKVFCRYNLPVGIKVLDLITELVQGEVHDNIAVLLNKTFIYDMCRVLTDFNQRYHTLPRAFGMNPFHKDFIEFKSKIIFLFKTILENKNEKNTSVLTQHLDLVGLMENLYSLITEFIKSKNLPSSISNARNFIHYFSNEDFKGILGDVINIYIIFRYIWSDFNEFNDRMRELIRGMDKSKQDLMDKVVFSLLFRITRSIEIVVDTKAQPLMRVWFPVIAVCHYLQRDTKLAFIKRVDRSNSQTKISSLIDASQEFIPEMYAGYRSRKQLLSFNVMDLYYLAQLMTNWIAVIIVGINIGTYKLENENSTQSSGYTNAVLGLNIVQLILIFTLICLWSILLRKRHQTLVWERYVDQNIKTIGFLPPTIKSKLDAGEYSSLTSNECKLVMKLKGANTDEFKETMRCATAFRQIRLEYLLLNTYFAIRSLQFVWYFIYFGIVVGSFFHPLAAVFQLLDIVLKNDTVQQIYASISRNAKQFVWTLFLLVITNVVYSSIGFFFLNDMFVNNDNVLCETAFACFVNVLNQGLRSGGGIGDIIKPQPYAHNDVGIFVGIALFDLSFFVLMIILLLNLIFGMIIDAFGELRDQKTRNDEDDKNVCFICGIERSEFERHISFEEHFINEHNMWAYINYIVLLLEKQKSDKNSMTDIENLVLEKYLIKNFEWIPISKSLTLETIYEKENIKKVNEFDDMTNQIKKVQNSMVELGASLKNTVMSEVKTSLAELSSKIDKLVKH